MKKITFIMNQRTGNNRTAGFSETWYFDGSMDNALTAANQVAKKRSALMTSAANISAFRIQDIGTRAQIFQATSPGNIVSGQDIPQMALNVRVGGQGVVNTKTFQLRGIPDVNVLAGDYTPAANFNALLSQFAGSLSTWSLRFRGENLANPQVNVLSISNVGVFALAADLVFAVGDYVTLLRCQSTTGKNVSGRYYVTSKVDARNGTFQAWDGSQVVNKGKLRKFEYIYPLVANNSLVIGQITTRKVGRPFDLYRGRATRR